MADMKRTADEIVKAIRESERRKPSAYDTTAEVKRIDGGTAWVHIPGGVDETPAALTIDAEVGDTVQVRVSGGSAWIVGNQTTPPTGDKTAKEALRTAEKARSEVGATMKSDVVHYLATDQESGVTVDTPGWTQEPQEITEALPYLWTYHTYTFANGNVVDSEPVLIGVHGQPGEPGEPGGDGPQGDTGVSVSTITTQYYLSLSDSIATGGSWSTSLPAYVSGRYYWTREYVTYSDGTDKYSPSSAGVYSPGLTQASKLSYNTAQHFWTRNVTSPGNIPNGAYVTEQTESSYLSNPTGGATLIRSDKVDILVGNKPYSRFDGNGTHIYEGTGTPASPGRELATFSGSGVRFQNENDVKIFDVGYTASQTAQGHIDVFPYDNSAPFEMQLPWDMNGSAITLKFFTNYPVGQVTGITTTGHYAVDTSTSKVTLDSTLCSSLRSNNIKFVSVSYSAVGSFPYYILGTSSADPTTLGEFSAMIGENNRTKNAAGASLCVGESNMAGNLNSVAAGQYSETLGMNCMAIGKGAAAGWGQGQFCAQLAIGEYNKRATENGLAFVIGNGSDDNNRSNAFEVRYNGDVKSFGAYQDFFKIVDLSWTEASIAAHDYNAAATHTVASANRPAGMTLVGIVGFECGNYRIYPRTYQVNGAHSISVSMTNATAAASASATVTAKLLYIKATSA